MSKSTIALIGSLFIALGGWGTSAALQGWVEVAKPVNIFAIVGIVGGVFWAWSNQKEIK